MQATSGLTYRSAVTARPLLVATVLTAILFVVPFGELLTYPFLIFATFVHETAHASATLLTSGDVNRIELYWNGAGATYSSGGFRMLISSAGYIGTALFGAMLLLISRKRKAARLALIGCAVLVASITVIFGSGLYTWIAGACLFSGLLALWRYASIEQQQILLALTAVQCSLHSILALKNLWFVSVTGGCSDAQNMASYTGLPAVFWAALWIVSALAIFFLTLRKIVSKG